MLLEYKNETMKSLKNINELQKNECVKMKYTDNELFLNDIKISLFV